MVVGESNIIREPLVGREKTNLPPPHIKLGLMKQFMIALDHDSPCFTYLGQKRRSVSSEKLKAGILDGTQIRLLINDSHFVESMDEKKENAWKAYLLLLSRTFWATKKKGTKLN